MASKHQTEYRGKSILSLEKCAHEDGLVYGEMGKERYTPWDKEVLREKIRLFKLTGDLDLRDEILNRNFRSIIGWAGNFGSGPLSLAELVSEGFLGLSQALESYDERKGQFPSYATNGINWAMLHALRGGNVGIKSLDVEYGDGSSLYDFVPDWRTGEGRTVLDQLINMEMVGLILGTSQKLFEEGKIKGVELEAFLRYCYPQGENESLEEISLDYGCSKSNIGLRKDKVIQLIRTRLGI
jgi:hypothetical protein